MGDLGDFTDVQNEPRLASSRLLRKRRFLVEAMWGDDKKISGARINFEMDGNFLEIPMVFMGNLPKN